MSTAATMEQVESVGVGGLITVGKRVWERIDDGWKNNIFVIPDASVFAGDVTQGRVSLGVEFAQGQMWDYGRGMAYILVEKIDDSDRWWAVGVDSRSGTFIEVRRVLNNNASARFISERPDWYESAYSFASNQVRLVTERDAATTRAQDASRELARRERDGNIELNEYRDRLQSSLHEFMRANDFGPDHPLNELLAEHSMRRLPQMIDVTVSVSGRTYEELGVGVLQPFVSNATVTRNSDVTIYWEKTVTVSVEVESGVCGCGLVTYSAVAAELRKEDLPPDYFTYGSTCPNDD